MKICLVHNTYQIRGGEDGVVEQERNLLVASGHEVTTYFRGNDHIQGLLTPVRVSLRLPYSWSVRKQFQEFLLREAPQIVHVHNFFPLLTPSIYDACRSAGIPVVQTLHNYRTICPGALLLCDSQVCEKCLTGSPYQAVVHRCYRNSRLASLAVARMVAYHRKHDTWNTRVDRFIALSEFAKSRFVAAVFSARKIAVKPNFYAEKKGSAHSRDFGNRSGALYVGRLSAEKGIRTLLRAWSELTVPLWVAGGGPLLDEVQHCETETLHCLGQLGADQVATEMSRAVFLVLPSECYENFPLTLAEAFAHGLPVIASRLGAMAEIVEDGVTGLHFEPGDAADLAAKVRWLNDHPEECRQMGCNARREFEAKYTPERNYDMLMTIYQEAIDEHQKRRQS